METRDNASWRAIEMAVQFAGPKAVCVPSLILSLNQDC